jgi:hypothetical protein
MASVLVSAHQNMYLQLLLVETQLHVRMKASFLNSARPCSLNVRAYAQVPESLAALPP